jgi:hypothetical protein
MPTATEERCLEVLRRQSVATFPNALAADHVFGNMPHAARSASDKDIVITLLESTAVIITH